MNWFRFEGNCAMTEQMRSKYPIDQLQEHFGSAWWKMDEALLQGLRQLMSVLVAAISATSRGVALL